MNDKENDCKLNRDSYARSKPDGIKIFCIYQIEQIFE